MRCLFFAVPVVLALTGFPRNVAAQAFCEMRPFFPASSSTGLSTPTLSGDGRFAAFQSFRDLVGMNPDGSFEIFLYDLSTGLVSQVTSGSGNLRSDAPSLSDDGTTLAFTSDTDPTGENPDLSPELFYLDIPTGIINQATNTTARPLGRSQVAVSADGGRIAFIHVADYTPPANSDNTFEVFLYDRATDSIRQISRAIGTDDIFSLDISQNGRTVVFTGARNEVGRNADLSREVFAYDVESGVLRQITDRPQPDANQAGSVSVDPTGTLIAFASEDDPLGTNPQNFSELFLFDSNSQTLRQLTFSRIGFLHTQQVQFSADGSRIFFASDADLTGFNTDGSREAFFVQVATGQIFQATSSTARVTFDVVPDRSGTRVLISSAPFNSGGQEFLLLECPAAPGVAPAIPAISPAVLALLIALLTIAGVHRLR